MHMPLNISDYCPFVLEMRGRIQRIWFIRHIHSPMCVYVYIIKIKI